MLKNGVKENQKDATFNLQNYIEFLYLIAYSNTVRVWLACTALQLLLFYDGQMMDSAGRGHVTIRKSQKTRLAGDRSFAYCSSSTSSRFICFFHLCLNTDV